MWHIGGAQHIQALLYQDAHRWQQDARQTQLFEKPENTSIVAHVMYKGRDQTAILECYLRRNLVAHGGFIDSVVFFYQAGSRSDRDWLNQLAKSNSAYQIFSSSQVAGETAALENVSAGTLYILLGAEVVFLDKDTIPSLVKMRIENQGPFAISANVINQPVFSWIHHHLGAILHYRPELRPVVGLSNTSATPKYNWRASSLPQWNGDEQSELPTEFGIPTDFKPPFRGHRWLPLKSSDPIRSPLPHEVLDVNGPGRWPWTIGAQHHYSFLEHLERGELHRYKFPSWDFQHEPFSPSVLCVYHADKEQTLSLTEKR
ncbi:MAG: hypothetical protein Q9227_009314 [Pyrenula ochraceoflavens]